MTTVAWDGRYLAADTGSFYGNERAQKTNRKVIIRSGYAFGYSGAMSLFEPLIEWWLAGRDPKAMPTNTCRDGWNFLVINSKLQAFGMCMDDGGYPSPVGYPYSIGSGSQFALGAMGAGLNAAEAVAVASRFDVFTTVPVTALDLLAELQQKQAAE